MPPKKTSKSTPPVHAFVLDTNVLLHDPEAIFKFGSAIVAVPIYVIQEIDKFKSDSSELGRNARQAARCLDELGMDSDRTPLPRGGELRLLPRIELPLSIEMDDLILDTAAELELDLGLGTVTVVSRDTNVRLRALASRLKAANYEPSDIKQDESYKGFFERTVSEEEFDAISANGVVVDFTEKDAGPSDMILLRKEGFESTDVLIPVDCTNSFVAAKRREVWGIYPKNDEQVMALEVLMNPDIHIVTLVGAAGVGKTLLVLAAGLHMVTEEKRYDRVLTARPVMPLGKDIGYLPGSTEEKLLPWMMPVFDNLEVLMKLDRKDRARGRSYQEIMDMGLVAVEPITFIRGRSISNQFMYIDEAQNLSPHEIKTIITRAGEGTKIILAGDPAQIDNPKNDSLNNGLVYAMNKFRGHAMAAHVTLSKTERSPLAELAAKIL